MLGGQGSMMLAKALMKMNRRGKSNAFKKDKSDYNYNNNQPLVLKKASEQKVLALKEEVDRLKSRELIRVGIYVVLLFLTIIGFTLLI